MQLANLLNLNFLKNARQQLIYAVFAVILGIIFYNGIWFVALLIAFFVFRFPRFFWVFILIFITSIVLLSINMSSRDSSLPTQDSLWHNAYIRRIRRQNDEIQTAIISMGDDLVFMTFRNSYPRLVPGQTISIYGRISTPSSPTVPHRFDFQNFLFYQGIYYTIHTSDLRIEYTSFSPWRWQHDLADWIRGRFPPLTAGYLQAFFLGVRTDIDEDMMDVYNDLGILHVFAISGVHVTLLTGMIKDFLKRCYLVDIIVDAVLIVFCIAFIFVTGASVSIIRASLMGIFAILNRRFRLGFSSFDIFSLVFILNFVVNPRIVFSSGFQFSYWIAFVLMCSRPVLKGLSSVKSRLAIVFLARMASIPLSVASGFEINVTSYIANLLLVPLLMQIIFPALLITLFLPFLAPITDTLLMFFEYLNGFLLPFLSFNLIFGAVNLPIVLVLQASLLLSCYFFEKHKKLWIRFLLLAFYIVVLEGNRIWHPYTAVTFLDVGQGDATILRSPHQSCTIVVDTGGDVSRIRSADPSIFSNTIEPYLLGNGVRNVDFLILTHEHYDHIAEAIPLMNRFNVKNIILSEAEHGRQMQEIVAKANRLGIPIHTARPMDTFTCGNQIYTFIHDEIDNYDFNEDSLVMTVTAKGFNIMITGDIGHPSEAAVLNNNSLSQIHFYQVAHHGSRYSNSLEFMDALNIDYAIVQVGRRNLYSHPHQELFDVVDALGIPLLNNAVHGTVQIRLRNNGYEIYIWPFE